MTGIVSILFMLNVGTRHEEIIVGAWKEIKWTYEGAEDKEDTLLRAEALKSLRSIIGQDFLIHENETWIFTPEGQLITSTKPTENDMRLRWLLKGRGNILVIKNGDIPIESYNITKLNDEILVLSFNVEIGAKGVAELTFERIRL